LRLNTPVKRNGKNPCRPLHFTRNFPIDDLESMAKGYILSCRCEGKSEQTIRLYQIVLRNLLWFYQQRGYPTAPSRITALYLREFLWYLASEPNRWGGKTTPARNPASRTTVHDYYRTVKTFLGWLERQDLIAENPFKNLKPPEVDKEIIKALTPDEIKHLFKVCSGKTALDVRDKAILSILLDCGLRVAELANLCMDDVELETGVIMVRRGKGGRQRTVHMGTQPQKAL